MKVNGEQKHAYEVALDFVKEKKVNLEDMVTHEFPIERFDEMIEVNMAKGRHQAVKTMVTF